MRATDRLQRAIWLSLIFGHLFIIVFESIFHLAASCTLFVRFKIEYTRDDAPLNTATLIFTEGAFYLSAIIFLLMFVVLFRILVVPTSLLEAKSIEKKYGFLWQEIRIQDTHNRFLNILFVIRRIGMAVVVCTMQTMPAQALQLCQLSSLFYSMFVVHNRPYSSRL